MVDYTGTVTLPRVRAALPPEGKETARVLRAALRHKEHVVPLVGVAGEGQLALEIDVPGETTIVVLAERVGDPTEDGQRLALRTVTRAQMAEILALLERIDEPSESVPPSAADESDDAEPGVDDGPTVFDSVVVHPLGARAMMSGAALAAPAPPAEAKGSGLGDLGDDEDDDAPTNVLPPDVPATALLGVPEAASPGEPPVVRTAQPSGVVASEVAVAMTELPPPSGASQRQVVAPSMLARIIANKYLVEGHIGSGASAAVYRAIHTDLRRPVAIKILHSQVRGQEQFVKRFKAEALAASRLEHVHVTRILDFGQERDGLLYLVMELLEGKTLEAELDGKPMAQGRAIDLAIQVCSALAFAHDEGVIHRDIKPENIMLTPGKDDFGDPCDVVKVCDFGLAKLSDPDPETQDITVTGMLCGSPAYMSPEQARGDKADLRTDVYSLGVSLFEAVTGELPHDGDNLQQLFSNKMLKAPRRPSEIVPGIDPLLEDIILRALSADRAARHATARVLREELKEARKLIDDDDDDDERDGTLVAG
jgi:eukaryotic-like serine/threonine-protein kinase